MRLSGLASDQVKPTILAGNEKIPAEFIFRRDFSMTPQYYFDILRFIIKGNPDKLAHGAKK
jgi:hypothetical protein